MRRLHAFIFGALLAVYARPPEASADWVIPQPADGCTTRKPGADGRTVEPREGTACGEPEKKRTCRYFIGFQGPRGAHGFENCRKAGKNGRECLFCTDPIKPEAEIRAALATARAMIGKKQKGADVQKHLEPFRTNLVELEDERRLVVAQGFLREDPNYAVFEVAVGFKHDRDGYYTPSYVPAQFVRAKALALAPRNDGTPRSVLFEMVNDLLEHKVAASLWEQVAQALKDPELAKTLTPAEARALAQRAQRASGWAKAGYPGRALCVDEPFLKTDLDRDPNPPCRPSTDPLNCWGSRTMVFGASAAAYAKAPACDGDDHGPSDDWISGGG